MQVTYQKRDGSIIQRIRNTALPYKIGDETSMGWIVLNIEYEYNNKYYPEYKYHMLVQERKQKYIKKQEMKKIYINHLRSLMYYCIAMVVINLLKFILGL